MFDHFVGLTRERFPSVSFTNDDSAKIMNNLNPNKPHGDDMTSVRMLKICELAFCKPFAIIYKSFYENRIFPADWKKTRFVPVYKKGDKEVLES